MDLEALVVKFKLEDVTDQQASPTPEALLEYAQQIQNFFSGHLNTSKLDYYFGLVFPESKEEGLLGFLTRKITDRPFDKVKEAVFNLIQYVIVQKAWQSSADRFYVGFKNVANMYRKHEKETSRMQQAALDCLISLFTNYGTSLDLVEFEASQLYLDLLTKSEKTKFQPTVRGKMFHLMGILGYLGHDTFMQQSGWFLQLFNHVMSTVKAQVESGDSKLEVSILHGCIKGLDKLLLVFNAAIKDTDAVWLKFQENLQEIVDPRISIVKEGGNNVIKRREFQRAALEIVANHGRLIRASLFKRHQQWFEDLILWAKSPNADDNRIGRRAMNKFLDIVIIEYPDELKQSNASQSQQRQLAKVDFDSFYKFFADKFKTVLNTKNANKIELSIAVRGFGMLTNLCEEQEQSREMMNLIMLHIDNIIHELDSPVVDKYSGSISVLPTYLESVASILPSLKTEDNSSGIPEHHLESIKKFTILLIRFYPDLSESQRNYAPIPVQKLFDALWNHHHVVCESFIEQVYQQSLLHIVSCPTRVEIDILIESWNKTHPESKKSALSQLGLKPVVAYLQFWKRLLRSAQSGPHELQFDLMMQWILATIGKLDLSINFEDYSTSEKENGLNPDPVAGATATVIKDFQIFVNIVDFYQELMSAEKFLQHKFRKWIIPFSYEVLGYIKTNVFVSGFYKILSVVFDAARNLNYFEERVNLEIQNLHEKLNIFFQGLGKKIQEFRDDLLFSVLELWLSLPDSLILTNFTALNQTLKTVFITGKSSFPLAIKGLEAVERWCFQKDFPVEEISVIINSIFPVLKTYFISSSENLTQVESPAVASNSKSKKGGLKSLIKKNIQTSQHVDDATLKATQLKILHLVGSFGQFINLTEKEHLGLSKDQRFLLYAVPFQDCKPEVYIDDMLPRVLELCEHAVERQTRISACEFFHTLTLIFIGKSHDRHYKERLFRQIFNLVIKLACDSDIILRQLFHPLCLQIIHWFSKRNSPYGSAVMDILTENLTQNEDLNRRELAALCLGEFFLWSIRQGCDTDTKAKGVLKSIFAMSTHASPNYRQGSVMAFNSIYKDFREDTNLMSEFSFNLLFSFLTSLKLSKDLPEDCLLITSTKQAIKHLERILAKKKDRFNTAIRRHFKPSNSETPCLRDVVNWLVGEGGNQARVYRNECLRLVEVLCPITRGIASVEKCLSEIEESSGVDGWIKIAEGSNGNVKISDLGTGQLSFLDVASSFYEFLYKHKMLSKAIFHNKSRSAFCEKLLSMCTNDQLDLTLLSEDVKMQLIELFSRLRFAWEVLDQQSLTHLWTFSMKLSKITAGVDSLDEMGSLINIWCSGTFSAPAKLQCSSLLLFDPSENVNTVNEDQLVPLLKESVWHRDMAEGGLTMRILSDEYLQQLQNKLWTSVSVALFTPSASAVFSSGGLGWIANNLSMNRRKLVENYLVTALCLGLDEQVIVDAVFDSSTASYTDGTFQIVDTKGNVIQKELLGALVYCKKLFQFDVLLKERSIKDVGDFIQHLLSLVKTNRVLRKLFGESIFKKTLSNWKIISLNCDVVTAVKIFVGLLAVNIEVCRNSEELSSWWSGPQLMQARHLDLKQKAEVFGYVTVFAASRNKKAIIPAIMKAINYVVDRSFILEQNWTDVEQYVTHIFRKILKVFEQLPRNLEIVGAVLQTIAKVTKWLQEKTDHPLLRMARDSVQTVVKSICETDNDRVDLVSHIYKMITSGANKSLIELPSVWKSFLLPAVSALDLSTTKKFFKRHIYEIIKNMDLNPGDVYRWMSKTVSVHLLELLVYQTNPEFVKGKELSDAYIRNAPQKEVEGKTEDENIKIVYRSTITTCLNGIIKSGAIPRDNADLRQCIFNCYEASYNTLVATLIVTKGEFKFFSQILFCGKLLFEKLVDDNLVYEFPVFIDEASHRSGVISNSRKTKKPDSLPDDLSIMSLLPASGNLTGSSLAPEATSYDFTTSVTVANSSFYQKIFEESGLEGETAQKNDPLTNGDKLEWNEINKHGCMFAYVETLKQMHVFHRSQQADNDKWLKSLVRILNDRAVHNSVKTFLVGGIINTSESMEPFAADLVEPIIKLVLADCFGRVKLNYFVQDILITLLSWIETPGARPMNESVTSILRYIIEGVRNEEISKRKDVLNHVMEILQNVVKYWAPDSENVILIPSTQIYGLGPAVPTDESASLRLSVCRSILLGGQLPSSDVRELVRFLAKSSTSKYKRVYVTAAQCIGLLLRYFKAKVKEEAPEFLDEHLLTVGTKLSNICRTRPSAFGEILTAIHNHFPEIITREKNTIMELFPFPKVRSDLLRILPLLLKQLWAEALSQETIINITPSSPNRADEFFTDIDGRGLFNQTCKTNDDFGSALNLFGILIDNCAQPSKILKIVDWLANAETSDSKDIKTQFADCLEKLYERLLTEAVQTSPSLDPSIKQSFLKIFIRMYSDEREEIREVVNRFWNKVLQDWDRSEDLMLELLDLIGQEDHPLNVFIGLILQRCSLSPDHSKHIFQEPLENIQFAPHQLDTSWRLRHSTFQPLFAESLSSVKVFGTLPRAIQSSLFTQRRTTGKFGMNVLRATLANLQFTPTQQNVPNDTMEEFRMEVDQDSYSFDSSNIFRGQPGPSNGGNSDEHVNHDGDTNSQSSSLGNPILKLRKKFYAQKDSTFYATRGSEVRAERLEEARDLERSRISGVKTVRSYRIGELPDIMIRHSDLLNTLLKLAKQDENFGRQFIVLLFQGMLQEMQNDSRKSRKFLSKAKEIFDRVFRNTMPSPDRALATLLMELSIMNAITLPTTIVLDVCKVYNLQFLGILKLEQELLDEVDSSNPSSKRIRQICQSQQREDIWLGLAELYKEIEEYDVLRNIFGNAESSTTDNSRKKIYINIGNASHWEGVGHLPKAKGMYDYVLNEISDEGISTTGKMFLEDSLLNCVAELGDWDDLYTLTANLNPVEEGGSQNPEIVKRIIPMQMLSGMQLTLRNEDGIAEGNLAQFQSFVEAYLTTEEGTAFLTATYPFDIGVWLLFGNEEELQIDGETQAKLMLERGNENIIRQLFNVDLLPTRVQRQIIVSLQKSSILDDYCKWSKNNSNLSAPTVSTFEKPTQKLLNNWSKVLMHQPIDLRGSNLIASYRDAFLSKIGYTLQDMKAEDALLQSIQEQRVDQDLWLANLGTLHKNFSVSRSCLERLKGQRRHVIRPVEFRKSLAMSLTVFAKMFETEDWCKRWISIWKTLDKMNHDSDVDFIRVDLLRSLAERAGSPESGVSNKYASVINHLCGDSSASLPSCLLTTSHSLMPQDIVVGSCQQSAPLYKKLFSLLKKITDIQGNVDDPEVAEKMLTCILRGCTEKGDSTEMLLLSNIFTLLKRFPNLNDSFELLVLPVSSFLFLPWIDQILTAYKSFPQEYRCFKNLIAKLVKEFPHAFQLQYPDYLDPSSQIFGKALKAVVLPNRMHEQIVENISYERNDRKRVSLLNEFQASLQEIINDSNTYFGEYHSEYANDMFEIISGSLSDVSKSSQEGSGSGSQREISSQSWNETKSEIMRVHDVHSKKMEHRRKQGPISLEKLSPFLANFHFFEHASVERPGLYENFRKPNVQEHPLIVSFHPTVHCYSSLTRPIKLTVITNNGKRNHFLLKLGDDLRQDRRIQQLFKMSNVLFQNDVALKKKNLSLETYSCIPITSDFGLIEMVDNVMSLTELIFDSEELTKKRSTVQQNYGAWLRSNCGTEPRTNQYEQYRIAAKNVGREASEAFYTKMVETFPKFMLRDNIKKRSSSLQEFFSMRQSLIRSYGAMCMVHWLLGIGDRHLENCLLSLGTGNIVGIDFGRAFGTSNYIIPIPEMIPFRLTPQLQHIMMPYSYKGGFRESCIQTWNCLVDSSEIILTIANVFIQEPTLDWLKLRLGSKTGQEEKDHQIQSEEVQTALTGQEDFPFEILKRKLLNHNPTHLVLEELKKHNTKIVPAVYCRIVEEGRMLKEKGVLSNEEYVDVLLDLATEKNILSRMFVGMNPWT